jgi:hypothetical protein
MRNYLGAGLVLALAGALLGCAPTLAERRKSEALAASSFVSRISQGRPSKVFENWTPASAATAACRSRNAKLVLYDDGTREWEVELLSAVSRDLWEQAFHFYDTEKQDHTWFGSRPGGQFEIEQDKLWTHWRSGRGSPDPKLAQVYDKIGYVVWSARC